MRSEWQKARRVRKLLLSPPDDDDDDSVAQRQRSERNAASRHILGALFFSCVPTSCPQRGIFLGKTEPRTFFLYFIVTTSK